jgi:hypothetical protein
MTCQDTREEVAVALLTRGPLHQDVAAHLASCAECALTRDELSPIPGLLALVPAPAPHIDDDALLARVLDAVVAERRRRRWRTTLVAAAAAVLLVGGAGVLAQRHGESPGVVPGPGPVQSSPDILADATLHPASATSTVVAVNVTGLARGTTCAVSAVSADGTHYPVVTWTVGYRGTGHAEGTAPVPASDIVRVDLTDTATGQLLTSVVPSSTSSAGA